MIPDRRITYFESDEFFMTLDQLIRDRLHLIVTVPSKPPENSKLYKRLRICMAPVSIDEAQTDRNLQSGRMLSQLLAKFWANLFNRPNYYAYFAKIHSDREPLEVELTPL